MKENTDQIFSFISFISFYFIMGRRCGSRWKGERRTGCDNSCRPLSQTGTTGPGLIPIGAGNFREPMPGPMFGCVNVKADWAAPVQRKVAAREPNIYESLAGRWA